MSSHGVHMSGSEDGRDAMQAQGEQPVGQGRKPYRTPTLVVHGSVRELTLGAGGASADMNGTVTKRSKKVKPTPSDPSIKHNILRIGTHPLGIGLYLFDYKPGFGPQGPARRHFGVMADEVEQVMPQAVSRDRNGIRHVRHDLLGVSDLAQQLVH